MKVGREKRRELLQTLVSLVPSIRSVKGCLVCDPCFSLEEPDEVCLFEVWETLEDLERHRQSEMYKVLQGAMNLLLAPCEPRRYARLAEEAVHEWVGNWNGV